MCLLTDGLNDSSIKIMCGIPKEIKSEESALSYLLTSPLESTQFGASQGAYLGLCNRTSSVSKSLDSLLVGPGF